MEKEGWCKLHVINNCFNDGAATHLGLKYKGNWYCITHCKGGVLIEKENLRMNEFSKKNEYLKRIVNSAPNLVKPINAYIKKELVENFDKLIKQ